MTSILNFPANPTNGQTHTASNGSVFVYNAAQAVWRIQTGDTFTSAEYRTAAAQDVIDDGKQQKVDGQFFVSTTAGRAMDPPVGEFGLYSDYNGTPVLEHTQPMNARGIRGVGDGYAVPGSTTGEILYDDWEVSGDHFGPGDHITTTGTGDNLIGLTKTGDNVSTITLGDDAAARSAIDAQQQIDGIEAFASQAQIDDGVIQMGLFRADPGSATGVANVGIQQFLIGGAGGISLRVLDGEGDQADPNTFHQAIEIDGSGISGDAAQIANAALWQEVFRDDYDGAVVVTDLDAAHFLQTPPIITSRQFVRLSSALAEDADPVVKPYDDAYGTNNNFLGNVSVGKSWAKVNLPVGEWLVSREYIPGDIVLSTVAGGAVEAFVCSVGHDSSLATDPANPEHVNFLTSGGALTEKPWRPLQASLSVGTVATIPDPEAYEGGTGDDLDIVASVIGIGEQSGTFGLRFGETGTSGIEITGANLPSIGSIFRFGVSYDVSTPAYTLEAIVQEDGINLTTFYFDGTLPDPSPVQNGHHAFQVTVVENGVQTDTLMFNDEQFRVSQLSPGVTDINISTPALRFAGRTEFLESLVAPTGDTVSVSGETLTYTPSGGSAVNIDFDEFLHPVDSTIDQDVDAILMASAYSHGNTIYIDSQDAFYYIAQSGGHFHMTEIAITDAVTTETEAREADVEALTQHNHEQDARIAALEHRDFTTTITSFDTEAALTNLFTSGTIVNKGNFDNNLYQAWTVTREGHELIGYLQLTDTERDSFRSEFSLTEGSSSNIYVPANPDEPHTVGIKAFAAADYNDLSENTQIILAQISSMRFGGNFGSETQFEIRWEILNYSDAIDTGLGTVDSGEIYGAAGDMRYAFYAQSLYTTPAWEFREATVGRTEIVGAGGAEFSGNGLSQATTPTNVIVGDNLTATPAVTTMETWPLDGFIIRDMGPVIIGSSDNNSFPVVGPTSQDGLAVTMGAGGGSGGTSVARPITNDTGASIRMINATVTATISITCIDEFDMTFVVRNIDHTNSFSGTTTIPANSNNAEIEFTITGYGRTLLADESIEVYFNHNAGGVQNGTYTVTDLRFSLGSAEYGPETTMMDDFSMITLSASGGGAIPVTGSGQNIVGTTVVNGNLTGVALGTITGSSGPGEAPTAANVEPLFRDTTGDRSATFTQDSNEIVLTIGEDTAKVTTIRDVDGNALTKTNSEVTLPAFIQQTVNNTFSEPVVGSFVDDGGTARTISNIQHNAQGNLVVQSTGGQELTSELFTEVKARAALTNTATSLNAGTTLAGAEIATALSVTNLQTEANADARLAYFSGLGPFVGGTRGTATNAAFVKTGLNVPGSTATTAYYFISDKTWRATDSATGAILGIFGG